MKTAALIALFAGIAAAVIGIIMQSKKIAKAGKADKWSKGVILFAALFIVFAAVNVVLVIVYL